MQSISIPYRAKLEATVIRKDGSHRDLGVVSRGGFSMIHPVAYWKGLWRKLRKDGLLCAGVTLPAFAAWMYGHHWQHGVLPMQALPMLGLVTNAGVDYLAQAFAAQPSHLSADFKYHESGIGTTAAAVENTDIQTKINFSRALGSASYPGTAQWRQQATVNYTSGGPYQITEWGLFSAAGSGTPPSGGTLWDRRVFGAVTVSSGEAITFTYTCTIPSGGS
jgi:hypothetical protein